MCLQNSILELSSFSDGGKEKALKVVVLGPQEEKKVDLWLQLHVLLCFSTEV